MKKLIFKDKEFYADQFILAGSSIIFITDNMESGRLYPITDIYEYKIYNEDGTIGKFDNDHFNEVLISSVTDLMKLMYAIMKEITVLQEQVDQLKGGS